jgi:hypothetical protein
VTTTGIIVRSDGLRSNIESLKQLQASAKEGVAVRTRAEQLDKVSAALRVEVERVRLFRSRGAAPFLLPDVVGELLEATRKHRETFASDRVSLVADPEDSGFQWSYLERLPLLTRSVRSTLKTAWERHVDERSPEIADDLLDAFELVPEFKAAVEDVRRLRGEIAKLRSEPPDRSEPFDRLAEVAGKATERWRSVADDEVPAAIRQFLTDTADRGAGLKALNEEVLAWLELRDLVGSLRLVWRGSS